MSTRNLLIGATGLLVVIFLFPLRSTQVTTIAATQDVAVTLASAKHAYTIISSNFEIEPILDSYMKTYPDGQFSDYQVAFKGEYERPNTPYSYFIVVGYKLSGQLFLVYVNAWCKLNRGKWAMIAGPGFFLTPDFPAGAAIVGEIPTPSY